MQTSYSAGNTAFTPLLSSVRLTMNFAGFVALALRPNRVHIVRAFVESLSWRQGDLLATPDLLNDRPFHHVDEGVRVVPMDDSNSSGRILDG